MGAPHLFRPTTFTYSGHRVDVRYLEIMRTPNLSIMSMLADVLVL